MKFYLDEHLSGTVARLARSEGVDVVAADEIGRVNVPDKDHLALRPQRSGAS